MTLHEAIEKILRKKGRANPPGYPEQILHQ